MALSSLYTEATWSTERWFSRKVVDHVFNSNPIAMMLRRNARTINGGESLEVSAAYAANTGEWFSEWDTYTAAHVEQIGAGRLDWKLYTVPVVLSHLQLLKNSASQERRFDLAKQKNLLAAKTAADDLGSAVFNLNYDLTNQIDSLDHAVNDGTGSGDEVATTVGTYAQIDRTAADGNVFVATVDDSTTTLSLSDLQTLWSNCSEGNEQPTTVVSNNYMYNSYYDLLTPIQRQGTDDLMGKAGFRSLLFNGVPWIVDSHARSNTTTSGRGVTAGGGSGSNDYVYMLNMNHIELVAHRQAFFTFEKAVMPHNQWVHIGRYFFVGNLLCHAPRYQGKMTALTA